MSEQQSVAQRLANDNEICAQAWPENSIAHKIHQDTAAELRRLHAENQQLRAGMEAIGAGGVGPLVQRNHCEQHLGMVPAGWKLVPVALTREMQAAGERACSEAYSLCKNGILHEYRAMLAAAPKPPVVEQPQIDWQDMYLKEKRRAEMWIAKYEQDIGKLERAVPVAQQPQGEQELCCESWSVNRIDDLGKIVDSSGRLIATVYGSQAEKIVACHNSYTHPQPKRELRTDREITDQTEELAGLLMQAFHQREKADSLSTFRDSLDSRARHCWLLACQIQEMLTDTDPENTASELENGIGGEV